MTAPLLLVLSREYPPVTVGGTSTVARNLSVGLTAAGRRVAVVTTHPGRDGDERERIDGVLVHRVGTGRVYGATSGLGDANIRTHRRLHRAAVRLVEDVGRPDVIALPDLFCYPEAALLARTTGAPILNVLLQDFRALARQGQPRHRVTTGVSAEHAQLLNLEDKALRGSDHVVFISRALSDAVVGDRPDLTTPHDVVHLGVDAGEIAAVAADDAARRRLRRSLPPAARDRPLVVGCGRLVPVKGFAPLIRAMAELDRSGRPAHLALIGVGPEEAALRELARSLGIAGAVSFLGDIPRREALSWMSAATVGAVPSLWESFCYVCAEMMALGAPVVVGAVDSLEELVPDDRFGYRVPVTGRDGRRDLDPRLLAAALGEALADPAQARRRAAAGRDRILGTFTNARFAAGIAGVCDRLAASGMRAHG